jgi:hypothetical protein
VTSALLAHMKQQYIGFFDSGTLCPNAASQAPVAMPNYRTRNLQLVKQVNAASQDC